jgi:polar amino acid transport system substrate-binding protein
MSFTRRHALGLAAGIAFAFSATFAYAADPLKVGSYPANPPFENKTEAGGFEGYEVDIANEIAKRMGTTAEIEGMDFKALFVASASQRVDMVISSVTITNERLESQSFTQPVFAGALGVAAKDGAGIVGPDTLKGKVVGAIATTFGEKWVQDRTAEIGYGELKSYDTLANMLTDLQNGRIDAVVNDIVGLRNAANQTKGFVVTAEIPTGEKYAIMMPKGHAKLEEVNTHISAMKTDGTMAKFYEKWFGVAPAADSPAVTPLPVPTKAD